MVTNNGSGSSGGYEDRTNGIKLFMGTLQGFMYKWDIDDIVKYNSSNDTMVTSVNSTECGKFSNAWKKNHNYKNSSEGDGGNKGIECNEGNEGNNDSQNNTKDAVTCSLLVHDRHKLVRGYGNGEILIMDIVEFFDEATEADPTKDYIKKHVNIRRVTKPDIFLDKDKHGIHIAIPNLTEPGRNEAVVLVGHTSSITTLLHPNDNNGSSDSNILISGSSDMTIKVWNITSGLQLHSFANHSGPISKLIMFPGQNDINNHWAHCFCSISNDNIVGIYSIDAFQCLHLLSGHQFPIKSIMWRFEDEYFFVECIDGTVYVWQLGNGHLDRIAHGILAQDILESCDAQSHTGITSSKGKRSSISGSSTGHGSGTGSGTGGGALNTSNGGVENPIRPMKFVNLHLTEFEPPLEILIINLKRVIYNGIHSTNEAELTLCRMVKKYMLSLLYPHGLDANLDALVDHQLFDCLNGKSKGIGKTFAQQKNTRHPFGSPGIIGPHGTLTVYLPSLNTSTHVYQTSPMVSAMHMLSCTSLMNASIGTGIKEMTSSTSIASYSSDNTGGDINGKESLEKKIVQFFATHCHSNNTIIKSQKRASLAPNSQFVAPSILVLMYYFQDTTMKRYAKTLLYSVLESMSEEELDKALKWWLPYITKDGTKKVKRASVDGHGIGASNGSTSGQSHNQNSTKDNSNRNGGKVGANPSEQLFAGRTVSAESKNLLYSAGASTRNNNSFSSSSTNVVLFAGQAGSVSSVENTNNGLKSAVRANGTGSNTSPGASTGSGSGVTNTRGGSASSGGSGNSSGIGSGSNGGSSVHEQFLPYLVLSALAQKFPKSISPAIMKTITNNLSKTALDYTVPMQIRLTAVEILADGMHVWKNEFDMSLLISKLVRISSLQSTATTAIGNNSNNNSNSNGKNSSLQSKVYMNVLKKIARMLPKVFLGHLAKLFSVVKDNPKDVNVAVQILKIVYELIRDMSQYFNDYLSEVCDIIVSAIDPHNAQMQSKATKSYCTGSIQELIKNFKSVSFHGPTQKLALASGKDKKTITIYDIKAAKVWQEIKPKQHNVTSVLFNQDGSVLGSYCEVDGTVLFFEISSSFLSIFDSSVRCLSTQKIPIIPEGQPHDFQLVWIAKRSLTIVRSDDEYNFDI